MQGQFGIAFEAVRFADDASCAVPWLQPEWRLNGQFGNFLSSTIFVFFALMALSSPAQDATVPPVPPDEPVIEFIQNQAEVLRSGSKTWDVALTNVSYNTLHPGDRLRTGTNSRAGLRLPGHRAMLILDANSFLIIPNEPQAKSAFELLRGRLFNFHRGPAGEQRFKTPTVSAIVRGTDFALKVDEDGTTIVSMIDGQVYLENSFGQIELKRGEEAVVQTGAAPRRTAAITTVNVVQWCFYYPGVLNLDDLSLSADERDALKNSLASYRAGDLPGALANYPATRTPISDSEKIYHAALLLAVGQVEKTEVELNSLSVAARNGALAESLHTLIAAVKRQPPPSTLNSQLSTELLAASYYEQSRAPGTEFLKAALELARQATVVAPQFGFAWERVAELEFGFGRTHEAEVALNKSLELSPRNAEALALNGFVLSAQNHIGAAITWFDRAIAADAALGNAWLGRGLCRIRSGNAMEGRSDLLVAAAVEPNRSLFRSYLGKAFADEAHIVHGASNRTKLRLLADKELDLAAQADPFDPTPWLYLALLQNENNQTADAIESLEKSQRLNPNRAIYRSRLLLDQDQAVRSANLANIFADAGMNDVSVRESARAVSFDYANFSAHLNLASSFNELRDPTRFNLRYESEWFNEHLLASLLAPPGAVSLSQNLSQQEYSRLFAADRFGLSSTTEYLSTGEYRETVSHFSSFGGTSYALDLDYQHNDGVRVNNGLDRIDWYSRIKQQITPSDSLLLLAKYQDYDSGDNFQYYKASSARPAFHFSEMQAPLLLAGWHHEWSPGNHTLFIGGRLVNDQNLSDVSANQRIAVVNPPHFFDPTTFVPFDLKYHSRFEIYSAELNQIFQRGRHTDIFGARFQDGTFQAENIFANPPAGLASSFLLPSVSAANNDFQRLSLYAYHHWEIIDGLMLIGGLAYDDIRFPANFRRPPLNTHETRNAQISPKAALLWSFTPRLRARAVYSQAVGGVSYDESVRLEPTQLAGFSQSFRSLISESLVGSVEAPRYEIMGAALDYRPWTNAWLSLQGEILSQQVNREMGIFDYNAFGSPAATPGTARQLLAYREYNARLVFNQIVGRDWFLEAQYQFTRSELSQTLPDIAATPSYARTTRTDANLHQFELAATWRHPSGVFARGEFWEMFQKLGGSTPQMPGDDFQLVNLYVGYRFPRRNGEITIGVMNLFDEDYHFSSLNYHPEYPHGRAFYTRLRFNF